MKIKRERNIAIFLFVTAVFILVLFSFLEIGTLAPKFDSFAYLAFIGLFTLTLSILFFGRWRSAATSSDDIFPEASKPEPVSRSIGKYLLFLIELPIFLYSALIYGLAGWAADSNYSTPMDVMLLGLIAGLVGMVATLLGKRKLAIIGFLLMVVLAIPLYLTIHSQ